MPYCKQCGTKLPKGAVFCPNCGAPIRPGTKPVLASWGSRFIAWIIDMIILGFITAWISWPGYLWIREVPRWIPFVDFGVKNFIHFLYWMVMEGYYGQSIGKMVMKIKVTRLNGQPIDIGQAAIESIGKAFLLPIDCIIGWVMFPSKKQRLFNHLSNTIVSVATFA